MKSKLLALCLAGLTTAAVIAPAAAEAGHGHRRRWRRQFCEIVHTHHGLVQRCFRGGRGRRVHNVRHPYLQPFTLVIGF